MTDTAATRATETLSCPECDEQITGPLSGAGSAKFKLASHRYRLHKVRSENKRPKAARGREAQTDGELADHPAIGILRDARDQIPAGTGAPSSTDLTRALGRGLGLVTMAAANYAVETDELLTDDERDAQAAELALTAKQAEDVMRPLGKAIAPTKLNRKFGRQVVENVDAISSVAELTTLALHWRRYFRNRAIREGRRPELPPVVIDTTASSVPPPAGPGRGGAPVDQRPGPGQQVTTPAPTKGVVVSAEMVRPAGGNINGTA